MAFRVLNQLTEPYWNRQPDESLHAYTRFCQYRDMKRGERSLSSLAESHNVKYQTVHEQAKAHRWADRVSAWDDEQTRQHDARISARAERVAEAELSAAEEYLMLCRKSARQAIESGELLEPDEIPKWTAAAINLRQAAQKAPEHTRAVYRHASNTTSTGQSQAFEVEIPELKDLPHDAQRQRLTDMLEGVQRLAAYNQRENQQGRDA